MILERQPADVLAARDVSEGDGEPAETGFDAPLLGELAAVLEVDVGQGGGGVDVLVELDLVHPQYCGNVEDPEAEAESSRPPLLDPGVIGVVDGVGGDVEGDTDVGVDGDGLVPPLDLGEHLRSRASVDVLPARGQAVSATHLPLEAEAGHDFRVTEPEIVLEAELGTLAQRLRVEPDGGCQFDKAALELEVEPVEERLVETLSGGGNRNRNHQYCGENRNITAHD